MKTSELTGVLLDYWVAMGKSIPGHEFRVDIKEPLVTLRNLETGKDVAWSPSTNWAQGGPIIERERLSFMADGPGGRWGCPVVRARGATYVTGETPLIAAMRCYVVSKFGDEVPDSPQ